MSGLVKIIVENGQAKIVDENDKLIPGIREVNLTIAPDDIQCIFDLAIVSASIETKATWYCSNLEGEYKPIKRIEFEDGEIREFN